MLVCTPRAQAVRGPVTSLQAFVGPASSQSAGMTTDMLDVNNGNTVTEIQFARMEGAVHLDHLFTKANHARGTAGVGIYNPGHRENGKGLPLVSLEHRCQGSRGSAQPSTPTSTSTIQHPCLRHTHQDTPRATHPASCVHQNCFTVGQHVSPTPLHAGDIGMPAAVVGAAAVDGVEAFCIGIQVAEAAEHAGSKPVAQCKVDCAKARIRQGKSKTALLGSIAARYITLEKQEGQTAEERYEQIIALQCQNCLDEGIDIRALFERVMARYEKSVDRVNRGTAVTTAALTTMPVVAHAAGHRSSWIPELLGPLIDVASDSGLSSTCAATSPTYGVAEASVPALPGVPGGKRPSIILDEVDMCAISEALEDGMLDELLCFPKPRCSLNMAQAAASQVPPTGAVAAGITSSAIKAAEQRLLFHPPSKDDLPAPEDADAELFNIINGFDYDSLLGGAGALAGRQGLKVRITKRKPELDGSINVSTANKSARMTCSPVAPQGVLAQPLLASTSLTDDMLWNLSAVDKSSSNGPETVGMPQHTSGTLVRELAWEFQQPSPWHPHSSQFPVAGPPLSHGAPPAGPSLPPSPPSRPADQPDAVSRPCSSPNTSSDEHGSEGEADGSMDLGSCLASGDKRIITRQMLEEVYHLPINVAAANLGLGVTVLKKYCRHFKVGRWPFRKLSSIDKLIETIKQESQETPEKAATAASLLHELVACRAQIYRDPMYELPGSIKRLRQANFKNLYKHRHAGRHSKDDDEERDE